MRFGENGAQIDATEEFSSGRSNPTQRYWIVGRLGGALFHQNAAERDRGGDAVFTRTSFGSEIVVGENLFLGHLPARRRYCESRHLREKSLDVRAESVSQIDPRVKAFAFRCGASVSTKMVEIGKGPSVAAAKIIAFDNRQFPLSRRSFAISSNNSRPARRQAT